MGWLKLPLAGAAAWAACGLGAVALAQSPARRGVEVWYGVERVSDGKEAAPPHSEPAAPRPAGGGATLAPGVYVLPTASYPFTPTPTPAPNLLPGASAFLPDAGHSAGAPLPPARTDSARKGHGEVVPTAHWSEDRPGDRLGSAAHGGERIKSQSEAPRPKANADNPGAAGAAAAPPPPSAPAPAHPGAENKGEGPSSFLYQVAVVQLVSAIGSLVVGPLVLLLAVLFMLRRFKGAGSLLRVEVVNSGTPAPTIVYGGPAAWPAPVPAAGGDGAEVRLPAGVEALTADANGPEVETTAQPFELGPTYEEERRQREEAERQREQAVMQHVYEDNVRLREQLGQLEEGPAAEAPLTEAAAEGEAVPV
jgi:hypothetical protein